MVLAQLDFRSGVEEAWTKTATFVPKFVGFLAILVIGWFVAKIIAKVADRVLERLGFDQAMERGGIRKALARSKYDPSDVASKIIFYVLFLVVLQMAFGALGPNPVSDLITSVVAYLPKLLAAIVIVVVAAAIAAAVKEIVESALGGLSYGRSLAVGASAAILVIGGFAALNQLQIAQAIVNGLFYALLAIVAGSAIIAIGGGGIQPMRARWERSLERWDRERPLLQREMQTADQRIKERAEARARQMREEVRGEATTTMPGRTTAEREVRTR